MKNLPSVFSKNRDNYLDSIDHLFDKMLSSTFPEFGKFAGIDFFGNAAYPKCNIIDHEDKVKIEAAVPGLSKDQIKLEIDDGYLILSGDKQDSAADDGGDYIRHELKRSKFQRTFLLGDNVDPETISARFGNGILTVEMSKTKVEKTSIRQININ